MKGCLGKRNRIWFNMLNFSCKVVFDVVSFFTIPCNLSSREHRATRCSKNCALKQRPIKSYNKTSKVTQFQPSNFIEKLELHCAYASLVLSNLLRARYFNGRTLTKNQVLNVPLSLSGPIFWIVSSGKVLLTRTVCWLAKSLSSASEECDERISLVTRTTP